VREISLGEDGMAPRVVLDLVSGRFDLRYHSLVFGSHAAQNEERGRDVLRGERIEHSLRVLAGAVIEGERSQFLARLDRRAPLHLAVRRSAHNERRCLFAAGRALVDL
jgi:hypothetical protein